MTSAMTRGRHTFHLYMRILFVLSVALNNYGVFGQAVNSQYTCPGQTVKNIVCYVALWYEYPGFNSFKIDNLDPFLCTHIIAGYADIHFTPGGNDVTVSFGEEDGGKKRQKLLDSIIGLRKIHPSASYIVSMGGYVDWKQDKHCEINERVSGKFVESAIKIVERYRADGIEFYWNFPGRAASNKVTPGSHFSDVECLRGLTKALCEGMREKGLICMITLKNLEMYASSNPDFNIYMQHTAGILKDADYVNVWAMDLDVQDKVFAGDFLRPENLPDVTYSESVAELSQVSVNNVIDFYRTALSMTGASVDLMEKINMLISMQSRGYAVIPENANLSLALGVPAQDNELHPLYKVESEFRLQYPFFMMCRRLEGISHEKLYLHEYKELGDLPFAYNFNFKQGFFGLIIPIMTQKSVKEKVKFAKRSKLGGVMIFQIGADDVGGWCYNQTYPILNAIKEQVDTCS